MTALMHFFARAAISISISAGLVGCRVETSQPESRDSKTSNPSASSEKNAKPINTTHVAKVKVLADGKILLDDKQLTIGELKAAFADLKEKNGTVWYYRENPAGEAPQQAMAVMKAVVEAGLPIKLSAKPDFSELFIVGLAVGAVCAGFAISATCGMSVKRASIAASIYLAIQAGITLLLESMF